MIFAAFRENCNIHKGWRLLPTRTTLSTKRSTGNTFLTLRSSKKTLYATFLQVSNVNYYHYIIQICKNEATFSPNDVNFTISQRKDKQLHNIMVAIYVGNLQKSCVRVFLEVLSVRNVFAVLRLVGNVARVVHNHQHLWILQFSRNAAKII